MPELYACEIIKGYMIVRLNTRGAKCYGFGHVTPDLGTWRTQGYLLYLVALLPLSLFFRFDVLVIVHLYDSL